MQDPGPSACFDLLIPKLNLSGFLSFYCILLLSALFVSSCHWSPVTFDEPLSRPLIGKHHNATTFGDALALSLDTIHLSVPEENLPSIIRLQDRCWCDPGVSTLFEPFDILRWELSSVVRTALDIQKQSDLPENTTSSTSASMEAPARETEVTRKHGFLSLFASFTHRRRRTAAAKEAEQSDVEQAEAVDAEEEPRRLVIEPHPWELDMRSYGFPLILDFTWWRRQQRSIPLGQVPRDAQQVSRV
ncbi:hypothetical protein PENSPDRAFT_1921 [Peniophora sp. CONT]|nr:hypothetical protein PENSPDRAFT_1921 [Peniophora sp. CONT]